MEKDVIARVVSDMRLSPEACRVVLYVGLRGEGDHEISHSEFAALLNHPGEKKLRAAIQLAIDFGYVTRTPGGRGHHDSYSFSLPLGAGLSDSSALSADLKSFSPAVGADLKDRVAVGADLNGKTSLSPALSADLNGSSRARAAATTTTTTPPTPTPTAGARKRPADTDLERLRVYLGDHSRAVDMMLESANHPPTWAVAVYGKFGPSGTQLPMLTGIPPDRWPAVLANALMDFAGKGEEFKNIHFDGFVRKAARHERNGNDRDGNHDRGVGSQAPADPVQATGTNGRSADRRSRVWNYE